MADSLDRLAAPAADLLYRVDAALLRDGFPPDHPIGPLLRRVGALPSDAIGAMSERRPEPLRVSGSVLRRHAEGYRRQRAHLPPEPGWGGDAGDRYEAERAALTGYLDDAADRLDATADYLDEVADWIERFRRNLAMALADVLGSAEAVRLRASAEAVRLGASAEAVRLGVPSDGERFRAPGYTAGPGAATDAAGSAEAAAIGAHVLRAADDGLAAGRVLVERWAGRLDELPYAPAPVPTARRDGIAVDRE